MPAPTVLVVEDDATDARVISEALGDELNLQVVRTGDDALRFLRNQDPFGQAPRPHFVLLDLNLPGKPGLAVLSEMKTDERLCTIPVVVLTTSRAERDRAACYRNHANAYVSKPIDLREFTHVLRTIRDFWGIAEPAPAV